MTTSRDYWKSFNNYEPINDPFKFADGYLRWYLKKVGPIESEVKKASEDNR